MADNGPGPNAASGPTLTGRDLEILVAALRSPKSGNEFAIEIDYDKLAGLIGSKTVASARNSWAGVRKKLMSNVPPTAAGASTKADGAGTKTKTPIKAKSTENAKNANSASKKAVKPKSDVTNGIDCGSPEPASTQDVGGSADNNGALSMDDATDGTSGASLETTGAAKSDPATEANGISITITVEDETVTTTAEPVPSKGKGKEPATPEPEATADASAKVSTTKVTKKSIAATAAEPEAPGNDGVDADTAGAKAGPKTPGSAAGKKRGRKSNAEKAAEAAAAGGDGEASGDVVEEKPAKKPRKTPVKKAAAKKDIATTDVDIADIEADPADGESTAPGTPAADSNAAGTPTKKPAKPRAPRKAKDPNAPPSARSKAGKELKRQQEAQKVRDTGEKEAREAAEAEAEKAAAKAKKDKEVEDANAVLTGKKIIEKKVDVNDAGQETEAVNGTLSQVNANFNAAVSTTLADFEAAEAKSEVSSAVGMTNAKGKGKAKAVEEEVDVPASAPVGNEVEAEKVV